MRGNLFVVSRVGQLRNVQSFIKEYRATHNHLAILFTESNLNLAEAIEANVEPELFQEIVHVEQPLRPVVQGRSKNAIMYRQIEELLLSMVNDKEVDSLFLCNADSYYSLFERVAKDKNLVLELNFLEEGLGTYSNAGQKAYSIDTSVDWVEVAHRTRHFRRAATLAFRSLLTLAVTALSWVFRVDLVQFIKDSRVRLTVREQHKFGLIRHFDNAYVYFPDRIYSNNIQVDHVHPLGFVLEQSAPQALIDSVEDGAIVFVSQKYIPYVEYFSIVFGILSEMGLERVCFKFHPREDRAGFAKAWELAQREHPRLQVVSPPEIQSIPVEELMMAGKVKQVIGLTSTSLMYGKTFFPDVDVVSIGARFKEMADSDEYDISKRALAEFSRDLEVFLDVSGVRQF